MKEYVRDDHKIIWVYPHKISCKKCGEEKNIYRNGVRNLTQRYKCLSCNYKFSRIDGRLKFARHMKRVAAFFVYDELQLPFEQIVDLFGVKEKTMARWLERAKEDFENESYKEKMMEIRDFNDYYFMARKILKMPGDYYTLRKIRNEKTTNSAHIDKNIDENDVLNRFEENVELYSKLSTFKKKQSKKNENISNSLKKKDRIVHEIDPSKFKEINVTELLKHLIRGEEIKELLAETINQKQKIHQMPKNKKKRLIHEINSDDIRERMYDGILRMK